METRWRIELFGGLRVMRKDEVITRFRTQKTGALLAYLACYREKPHSREVLIELLWPESDPKSGRSNLSQSLSSLRRQLEPPGVPSGSVLVAKRFSVQLNPVAVITDVAEFEAALQAASTAKTTEEQAHFLTQAVELYRGELLLGYYDDWIMPEQRRLEELFFYALNELIVHLEQVGEVNRALDYARRGVAADLLREETHRELMRLSITAGQPAAALEQYRELERLLKEHDLKPSAATRSLIREIETASGMRVFAQAKFGTSSDLRVTTKPLTRTPEHANTRIPLTLTPQPSTGNLPPQLTRFFGREAEMAQLRVILSASDVRLVTLTGPGGSGKTRLAVQVAEHLQGNFTGGVWFVSLSNLSDARLIIDTVLDTLRGTRSPHRQPLEQLATTLSQQPALIVLDNFEQLVTEGAPIIHNLLERIPSLTCLITSRQRLNLTGEYEFPVPPLLTPSVGETPEQLLRCESVHLFVDRAQAASPDFQVTKGNAAAVAELCNRLEGIPLAIELAAARAQMLTPAQMLTQLKRRFDFLVSRKRDVAERHRTLRAAIDWSSHLLSPELQRFFARLSVFRGGWTLEAAEAVCFAEDTRIQGYKDANGDSPSASLHPCIPASDPLDLLAQLRECSLILSEERGQEMRYRMLETLREYAGELLSDDERVELSRRHAQYFLKLAEQAEPELEGPHEALWFARLDAEHDNLRAALEWCHAADDEIEVDLRLSATLMHFWYVRGYISEGREHLAIALSRATPASVSRERVKALYAAGVLAFCQNDYKSARAFHEESLIISRQLGDMGDIALSLNRLGLVAFHQGDVVAAKVLLERALAIRRELGNKQDIAPSLNNLGHVARRQGNLALARSYYEESLTLFREIGHDEGIADSFSGLGQVAHNQGDWVQASGLFREALMMFLKIGHRRGIAGQLLLLGVLLSGQGQAEQAARLLGAAAALCEAVGSPLNPYQQMEHEALLTTLRKALGEPALTIAYEAGRTLSWEEAAADALGEAAE